MVQPAFMKQHKQAQEIEHGKFSFQFFKVSSDVVIKLFNSKSNSSNNIKDKMETGHEIFRRQCGFVCVKNSRFWVNMRLEASVCPKKCCFKTKFLKSAHTV